MVAADESKGNMMEDDVPSDEERARIYTMRQLAQGLLEIAEMAMPDTIFQTDRRCQLARRVLSTMKSKQKRASK